MVARTAPFGAFVTVKLEDGSEADGLVHVSKIKEKGREEDVVCYFVLLLGIFFLKKTTVFTLF